VPVDRINVPQSLKVDLDSIDWAWDIVADPTTAWPNPKQENKKLFPSIEKNETFWSHVEAENLVDVCALETWEQTGLASIF
jgi:hypothetical protein